MAAEAGGIGSKIGGFYERRYAIEKLLGIVAGQVVRLRWEPRSDEAGGADIEVEYASGVVEHIQLKRQNRADAGWTVAVLDRQLVLKAAAEWLDGGSDRLFTFVSSDPVPHLKDICDQLLRHSGSAREFVVSRVHSNQNRRACFEQLLKKWGFDPDDVNDEVKAIARLRNMRLVLLDRSEEGRERLISDVQRSLTGEPSATVSRLKTFLEERLGQDIRQQDLIEHLGALGVLPRDLARDPSLPSALFALRNEFLDSLRERLVAGRWLNRPEAFNTLERILGDSAPRVVLVHGKPGCGKSGVLLRIAEALIEKGVAVLPLSLSSRPPTGSVYEYGASLGLHATPATALRATAAGRCAVLMLDQLDALRLTTSGATATWQICMQLLREALADPDMVVILACRTFDLENDPNIRRWRDSVKRSHPQGVMLLEVGDLAPSDVEPVVREFGVEWAQLTPRMQRLLVHPNTLDAWCQLAERGSARRDFSTQTELLSHLTRTLRLEASRDHGVSDAEVSEVLERGRKLMEKRGSLVVPASQFDDLPKALQACCSTGLLVQSGGSISFPHQSYFDHLVARSALRSSGGSSGEILAWVKGDQSLQRRDQLRQLLLLLRDEDPLTATQVADQLLVDGEVRFHLKQLVLGVLREAEPVTPEEADLVIRLYEDPEWRDHVRSRVLWRSLPWFDALYSREVWASWLGFSGDERVQLVTLLTAVMEKRPEEIDGLLQPLLEDPNSMDVLARALPFDPTEDSPFVGRIREAETRAGRRAMNDVLLDRLAEHDPARAVRLVEATIRGTLRRGTETAASEARIDGIRDQAFKKHLPDAVRLHAVWSFDVFSRLLRICEYLKSRYKRSLRDSDDLKTRYFRIARFLDNLIQLLADLVAEAVAGLAEGEPEMMESILNAAEPDRSTALSVAVALGLARVPVSIADSAMKWLCRVPKRLSLRSDYKRDPHGLATDILKRHAANCSEETRKELEKTLLTYIPKEEKKEFRYHLERIREGNWGYVDAGRYVAHINPVGRAQHLLIQAIPKSVRSPALQARLDVWNGKFGGAPRERPGSKMQGGWVGSPIPSDRVRLVSDKQWLDIVSRKWTGRRWKQVGPDRVAEAKPVHFANDMSKVAKESPSRFVRLALRFPDDCPPVYFARIWQGLSDKEADLSTCLAKDLDELLTRSIELNDRDLLKSVCRAIQNHAAFTWGEDTWRFLEYTSAYEDPGLGAYTVDGAHNKESCSDMELTSLNCARGAAASALAALVWDDNERAKRGLPLARALASDPHPSIRIAAAHTAFGFYTTDRETGVELMETIASHPEDCVLAGEWFNRLVQFVRWYARGSLADLFKRLVDSSNPSVAEQGAKWVTAERFQLGNCIELYTRCREGSVRHRVGIANTLAQLMTDDHSDSEQIQTEIVGLFNDDDPEVRSAAASVFRREEVLVSTIGSSLAERFVDSLAFEDNSEDLVWSLSHEAIDLTPYASCVFAAANRFSMELAPQTRSIQNCLGMAGREISALLLKLYDAALKAGDKKMAEACLDRWDSMIANRVGEADAHLEEFFR